MRRPWQERSYKRLSTGKGRETGSDGSEKSQRKSFHCPHCRYRRWSGEWMKRECCQETRSGPRCVGLKWFAPHFTTICCSQRSWPGGCRIHCMRRWSRSESRRVTRFCSDKRCHFLTILDNVLIVGEFSKGEKLAGRPHPHPGGLLEGVGERAWKNGVAMRSARRSSEAVLRKAKNTKWPNNNRFFYWGLPGIK